MNGGAVGRDASHPNHANNTCNSTSTTSQMGFISMRNNNVHRTKAKAKPDYASSDNRTAAAAGGYNSDGYDSDDAEAPAADYAKDWQKVAEVVDRMFFWVFLIAIVAVSLLLFHPLGMRYGLEGEY